MPVRSKPIQRDTLRFQFFIGRKPEDTRPGLNRTGNFTVTYTLPFHDDFTVANLKSHVEKEHDQITKQATRLTNESKRTERITVANAVVESIRSWFSALVDENVFNEAVVLAMATNTTTHVEVTRDCELSITPQHADSLL
jgi:hypothetical protein